MRWLKDASMLGRWLWCLLAVHASAAWAMDDGLEFALRSAAHANPQVLSKQAEIRALESQLGESSSARYPTFTLESRSYNEATGRGLLRTQQPVWAFGRIDAAIELAQQKGGQGRAELLEIRRRLLEETASTYVNLHGARKRLQVADVNYLELQNLVRLIERRQEGGLASDADARLAASRLSQANLQRQQLRTQIDKLSEDLKALTLQRLKAEPAVPDGFLSLPAASAVVDALEDAHASLLVKQMRLETVRREAQARKTELMPTISVRVDRDVSPALNSTLSPTRYGVIFESRLEGGGLAGYYRVEGNQARIAAASEDLELSKVEVRQKMARLLADRDLQQQALQIQETVSASMEKTFESFVRQYDAGRKSWLDVLNTQRELSDARQQLQSARTDLQETLVRMAAQLGRLDEVAGINP